MRITKKKFFGAEQSQELVEQLIGWEVRMADSEDQPLNGDGGEKHDKEVEQPARNLDFHQISVPI